MNCDNCGSDDVALVAPLGHIVMCVCNQCGHYWPAVPPEPETKEPA